MTAVHDHALNKQEVTVVQLWKNKQVTGGLEEGPVAISTSSSSSQMMVWEKVWGQWGSLQPPPKGRKWTSLALGQIQALRTLGGNHEKTTSLAKQTPLKVLHQL